MSCFKDWAVTPEKGELACQVDICCSKLSTIFKNAIASCPELLELSAFDSSCTDYCMDAQLLLFDRLLLSPLQLLLIECRHSSGTRCAPVAA